MINRRFLLVIACMAILPIGCTKKKEVTYEGKPLRVWIEMLEDSNPVTKYAAIRAVVEIGPEAREAIPILVETIRQTRNHDKRMLLACHHALLAMGKEIIPTMIALLEDDDWEMRRGGAWVLGQLGPTAKEAVPALTEALSDRHAAVRIRAAESLKKIQGEKASPY